MECEDIRVALDDDRPVLLRDRSPRPVEAVDDGALAEELALRRVHVLCRDRVVVPHAPRAEAEDPAARVGEREDEPPGVGVVAAAVDEADGDEVLLREALGASLLGEHRPAGREPEPVLAAHGLREAPTRQVLTRLGAGGRVPEVALIEGGRLLEEREQARAALALRLGLRRCLFVRERNAVALREPLDRAGEVEPLGLLHERDEVALHLAAEAVEELVHRVDGEARRPLLVEGAASRPARPDLSQLGTGADHLDHVRRSLHLVDRGLGDYGHASAKRSVMPAM